MIARAKIRKKETFKLQLSVQWQDFKIILQKCSSYALLPKLLKGSALLNKKVSKANTRKTKKLKDISSAATGPISK